MARDAGFGSLGPDFDLRPMLRRIGATALIVGGRFPRDARHALPEKAR